MKPAPNDPRVRDVSYASGRSESGARFGPCICRKTASRGTLRVANAGHRGASASSPVHTTSGSAQQLGGVGTCSPAQVSPASFGTPASSVSSARPAFARSGSFRRYGLGSPVVSLCPRPGSRTCSHRHSFDCSPRGRQAGAQVPCPFARPPSLQESRWVGFAHIVAASE